MTDMLFIYLTAIFTIVMHIVVIIAIYTSYKEGER